VGNDIRDNDLSRIPMRSPFEQNVVYHFDTQQLIFDYAFEHLGIDNDRINHPILLTEPVCNPNYSRKLMSELLFESYRVPSVCYGIDGLFSFYNQSYNQKRNNISNGLVINSGFQTTHILPVLNSQFIANSCKRINIGGTHSTEFILRQLLLKYPLHKKLYHIS